MVPIGVGEDFADVKLLSVVVNHGDDAKVVSSHIKHRVRVHLIHGVEGLFNLGKSLEIRSADQLVPCLHGFSSARMFERKVG